MVVSPTDATRETTRETIVETAAALLREHGRSALTTRRVAAAAGVQAPTIYRLFGDKDGLLEAVAEYVYGEYVAAKSREVAEEAGSDPAQVLRRGWLAHIGFGLANPDLYLLLNEPGRSSPTAAAGISALRTRIHRLAVAGRLAVDEDRATQLVHAAGTGTIQALLASGVGEQDHGLAVAMFETLTKTLLTEVRTTPPGDTGSESAHSVSADPGGAGHTLALTIALAAIAPDLPGLTGSERDLLAEWLGRVIAALQTAAGSGQRSDESATGRRSTPGPH